MQHGVIKVQLGGEEQILKFNNYFFVEVATILGCDPIAINEAITKIAMVKPMRAITIITFAAMSAYQEEIANYAWEIDLPTVAKWVGESNENEFTSVFEAFKDATGISDVLAKQTVTPSKTDTEKKKTPLRGGRSLSSLSLKSD